MLEAAEIGDIFVTVTGNRTVIAGSHFQKMKDGRKIFLLGEGRLINRSSAEGHPASVMDMSLANQALSAEYLTRNYRNLPKDVVSVPPEIDREIARLKLHSMGCRIDDLSAEQEKYLASWSEGT